MCCLVNIFFPNTSYIHNSHTNNATMISFVSSTLLWETFQHLRQLLQVTYIMFKITVLIMTRKFESYALLCDHFFLFVVFFS